MRHTTLAYVVLMCSLHQIWARSLPSGMLSLKINSMLRILQDLKKRDHSDTDGEVRPGNPNLPRITEGLRDERNAALQHDNILWLLSSTLNSYTSQQRRDIAIVHYILNLL